MVELSIATVPMIPIEPVSASNISNHISDFSFPSRSGGTLGRASFAWWFSSGKYG
jgi:hypothetical protein